MWHETQQSRTDNLDKDTVKNLASHSISDRAAGFDCLPEALTRKEVSDIGLQINLLPGPNEIEKGRKLERKSLFWLGKMALSEGDLVTAQSTASELKNSPLTGTARSLLLSFDIWKAKRSIVKQLTSEA